MNRIRRMFLALPTSIVVPRVARQVIIAALSLSAVRTARAVDPLTAIALAQTTLSLIRSFSAQPDGGLSAYLQSIHELQKLSLELLDEIAKGIGSLALQINDLRTEIPIFLEQSRLRAYLDDAISAQTQFRILRNSYDSATKSQKQKLDLDFLALEQQIVTARGRADSYSSFDAAIAVSLCLSVEVAAKYQNGKSVLIPETLRHYLNWLDEILNPNTNGSLARTLKDEASSFANLAASAKFKPHSIFALAGPIKIEDYTVIGCISPIAKVSYRPEPDVNQFIYSSDMTLAPRAIAVFLVSRTAGQTGAKEIYIQSADLIQLSANRIPETGMTCEAKKLTTTFGLSIDGRGVRVLSQNEIESFPTLYSEPEIKKAIESAQKAFQGELDSLNRKALRIALLSDAVVAAHETRSEIGRTMKTMGI